jgi:4-amino-4-deoxy-L-arabinose transferase-like glycosyltransferase
VSPTHQRLLLAFILLFGFCARAATFKSPLLDAHSWRQADTASISRNFYRERFNILYPQVDWRGDRPEGYVESGLEPLAFAVAALAKIGGFHPELGRLINTFVFLGSAMLVWTFVRRRYGGPTGLIATYLYAFGFPLLIFIERAFMNEALLIFLSLTCLVAAQRYLEGPGRPWAALVALVAASGLIAAIKLPYLIIWAPVTGLFLEKQGARVLRSWELWLMGAVGLAIAAVWYRHAHTLGEATGLSFGLTDKLVDAELLFSGKYVGKIIERLFKDVLGPVGFVGMAAGLLLAFRARRWCELFGAAAFLAYLLLVVGGNFQHDYYQLAIMPIAPAIIAPALFALGTAAPPWGGDGFRPQVLALVLALAAFATFVRSASFHSWYDFGADSVLFCDSVDSFARPNERVVFIGNNDPALLFCMDRKGWLLTEEDSTEERVRSVWRSGAKLAIVPGAPVKDEVWRLLKTEGWPVFTSGRIVVFRLP